MLLITMAEFVRRAYERIYKQDINEEDEAGHGITPNNYKERLYGSNRLQDRDKDAELAFIRQFGLFTGVRVKWYVEGHTEYGFIKTALDGNSTFEFINLKGQFAEGKGKGLAFKENIRNDKKSRIFSVISLDGDNDNNIRDVKNAASADDFMGRFLISKPDFEYANFSPDELEEIIWSYAVKKGAKVIERKKFILAMKGCKKGREMEKRAQNSIPSLRHFSKGTEWGKALLKYALLKPEIKDNNSKESKLRPMIDLIIFARRLISGSDFQHYINNYKVNPDTGALEKRD